MKKFILLAPMILTLTACEGVLGNWYTKNVPIVSRDTTANGNHVHVNVTYEQISAGVYEVDCSFKLNNEKSEHLYVICRDMSESRLKDIILGNKIADNCSHIQ